MVRVVRFPSIEAYARDAPAWAGVNWRSSVSGLAFGKSPSRPNLPAYQREHADEAAASLDDTLEQPGKVIGSICGSQRNAKQS